MLSCHLRLLISCDSLVFWILSFDFSFCLIAWYLYYLLCIFLLLHSTSKKNRLVLKTKRHGCNNKRSKDNELNVNKVKTQSGKFRNYKKNNSEKKKQAAIPTNKIHVLILSDLRFQTIKLAILKVVYDMTATITHSVGRNPCILYVNFSSDVHIYVSGYFMYFGVEILSGDRSTSRECKTSSPVRKLRRFHCRRINHDW